MTGLPRSHPHHSLALHAQLATIVKDLDDGGDGKEKTGKENNGEGLLTRLTAKFDAARAYSTDKMRLGFAESVFGEVEGAALLLLGMMCVWDSWMGGCLGRWMDG